MARRDGDGEGVVRLARACLGETSGPGGAGEGDGGRSGNLAAVPPPSPPPHAVPAWLHDERAVARRVAALADVPPGAAVWTDVSLLARVCALLLDAGPTPRPDLADHGLSATARLLRSPALPEPVVLPPPHDFLLTRFYYGTPTAAPCADLLTICASALADALDRCAADAYPPDELADLALDTATVLDGYRSACHALAAAGAPATRAPAGGAAN